MPGEFPPASMPSSLHQPMSVPEISCSPSVAPAGSVVYIATHVQKLGKTLHFVTVSLYKAGKRSRKLLARGDVIKAAAP